MVFLLVCRKFKNCAVLNLGYIDFKNRAVLNCVILT